MIEVSKVTKTFTVVDRKNKETKELKAVWHRSPKEYKNACQMYWNGVWTTRAAMDKLDALRQSHVSGINIWNEQKRCRKGHSGI